MAKIAITDWATLDPTPAVEVLEAHGHEVALLNSSDPATLIEQARDSDGLIVSFIELTAETLDQLPRLRVVATMAVGFNKIDVGHARARGIDVCNMPSAASEEVATHALAGMLLMLRELRPAYEQVESGRWDYSALPLPSRISDLTLGLYGLGLIARKVAPRALPFFDRVVAYDPYVSDEEWEPGIDRADSPDELLTQSDVISLHALLTDETRDFLNADTMAKLPAGAYVVNVSRGEMIDDDALLAALDSGQIRGAFVDVLDREPPEADNPLVHHPRVFVTPHTAFRGDATLREYAVIPAENVARVLAGEQPHTLVN